MYRLAVSSLALVALALPNLVAQQRYADPAICENCHKQIADNYRKTGMGRSFYRPRPADITPGAVTYHAASDTYFSTIERDGNYYQRRWQKGFDGKETNIDEKQIDFVMGSGNHVRAFLHLTDRNTLQQLPLGWYAEKGGSWAMSPGYDRPDYPGSTRAITYECMFCHNAYPKIPAGHADTAARQEFLQPLPLGIDCQRCHGPGQRHVELASRAGTKAEEIRAAIVNPKRLTSDREAEVCLQCHLETTSGPLPKAIRKFAREPFSYLPGQPLGDFRLIFDRAGGMGDRFEIAHAGYRMRQSQCFLKSEGKLRCTTCHDPHDIPRGESATIRYNAVCGNCHAATQHTTAVSQDCVSCHMPKRRTDDAVHVVMTDHFIRAQQPAGDLLAEKPEDATPPYRGEVVPYYPAAPGADAELYTALAQVLEGSNLKAGSPRLENLLETAAPRRAEFYAGLAETLNSAGERAKSLPWFEEAFRRQPDSALMLRRLGSAEMELGHLPKADPILRRVIAMAPDDAGAWGMLAQVQWREGRIAEAKSAFSKSIALDPELPEFHNSLATILLGEGDVDGAEKEFREAMRIQPSNEKVRANLASLLASRRQFPEARYQFERSIALKSDFAEGRLNYARMLASLNETADAEKQLQASIAADPNIAGAHQLLGALLATRADLDGAQRELETAILLQPDLWRAQFELGVVLGRKRQYAAAEQHLKLAAQGDDPEAKASALKLLQQLVR